MKAIKHINSKIDCDNASCNFTKDIGLVDVGNYLNKPCPLCGENLLAEEDYKQAMSTLKVINWINKWFGWLSIFSKKSSKVQVKHHDGVYIKRKE